MLLAMAFVTELLVVLACAEKSTTGYRRLQGLLPVRLLRWVPRFNILLWLVTLAVPLVRVVLVIIEHYIDSRWLLLDLSELILSLPLAWQTGPALMLRWSRGHPPPHSGQLVVFCSSIGLAFIWVGLVACVINSAAASLSWILALCLGFVFAGLFWAGKSLLDQRFMKDALDSDPNLGWSCCRKEGGYKPLEEGFDVEMTAPPARQQQQQQRTVQQQPARLQAQLHQQHPVRQQPQQQQKQKAHRPQQPARPTPAYFPQNAPTSPRIAAPHLLDLLGEDSSPPGSPTPMSTLPHQPHAPAPAPGPASGAPVPSRMPVSSFDVVDGGYSLDAPAPPPWTPPTNANLPLSLESEVNGGTLSLSAVEHDSAIHISTFRILGPQETVVGILVYNVQTAVVTNVVVQLDNPISLCASYLVDSDSTVNQDKNSVRIPRILSHGRWASWREGARGDGCGGSTQGDTGNGCEGNRAEPRLCRRPLSSNRHRV
mmetsp:Transcript_11702/g.24957  ORF Transcript_11702/g.24957 Transcript_11702/m.24957 type:complete len:484 (+) Transcript_11702:2-1453(+)